jgi:hypothetical protein
MDHETNQGFLLVVVDKLSIGRLYEKVLISGTSRIIVVVLVVVIDRDHIER